MVNPRIPCCPKSPCIVQCQIRRVASGTMNHFFCISSDWWRTDASAHIFKTTPVRGALTRSVTGCCGLQYLPLQRVLFALFLASSQRGSMQGTLPLRRFFSRDGWLGLRELLTLIRSFWMPMIVLRWGLSFSCTFAMPEFCWSDVGVCGWSSSASR